MHTDSSLQEFRQLTSALGENLRYFADETCQPFQTVETDKEYQTRNRAAARRLAKSTPNFPAAVNNALNPPSARPIVPESEPMQEGAKIQLHSRSQESGQRPSTSRHRKLIFTRIIQNRLSYTVQPIRYQRNWSAFFLHLFYYFCANCVTPTRVKVGIVISRTITTAPATITQHLKSYNFRNFARFDMWSSQASQTRLANSLLVFGNLPP